LALATTRLAITTYALHAWQALMLRTDDDMSMVDAAHASLAAPTSQCGRRRDAQVS
jgi:hypothetical protein